MALDGYPRWAMEDYEGSEKDFSEWMYQAAADYLGFKAKFGDKEADPYVIARVEAEIRHKVLDRTDKIDSLSQRAQMYQMWKANRDGWFRNLPGEFDSLQDLMASISEEAETPNSTASDLRFWVENMFPALEQFGFKPEGIIGSGGTFSKARAAVSVLRTVIKEQKGEQLAKTLHDILEAIMDPTISVRQFREMMGNIKRGGEKPSIWGDVYNLPGYSLIVIRDAEGGGTLRFLEGRTRGAIEYRGPKDPNELLKEITDVLMGEEDGEIYPD